MIVGRKALFEIIDSLEVILGNKLTESAVFLKFGSLDYNISEVVDFAAAFYAFAKAEIVEVVA